MTMRSGSGVPPISGQPNPIGTVNPINPYEGLIEQFLRNVELTGAGVQRGFENLREERMVEDQRGFQAQQAQLGREFELDQYARQREDALTDQALTLRRGWLDRLNAALPYLDPSDERYGLYSSLAASLSQPLGLTGMAARDAAFSGVIDLGELGQQNASVLISQLERTAETVRQQDGWQDNLFATVLEKLSSEAEPEARVTLANAYLAGNIFNSDMKNQMLAIAGFDDPARRQEIIDNGVIRQQDIAYMGLQIAQATTNLARSLDEYAEWKDLKDLRFDEANLRLQGARQALGLTNVEMFVQYGVLPENAEEAADLAARMGFDNTDDLRYAGGRRWEAFKRQEVLSETLLRNQGLLVGKQVDLTDVQAKTGQLVYDRDLLYGDLKEKKNLEEWVMAATLNGDVETLEMLRNLADLPAYAEALAGIQFDALITRATGLRTDTDDIRAHDRFVRQQTRQASTLASVQNTDAWLAGVADTFKHEDFQMDANGVRPVDALIDEYVSNLSQTQITNLGFASADELRDRLSRQAVLARSALTRSDGSKLFATLLEAGPPQDPAQRAQWLASVSDAAMMAGIEPKFAESIANGIIANADVEYYKAAADMRESQQRADLLYEQTVAQWKENNRVPVDELMSSETWQTSYDAYVDMHQRANDTLNSSTCQLPAGEVQFNMVPRVGIASGSFDPDGEGCQAAAQNRSWAEQQMARLLRFRDTGDPRHLIDLMLPEAGEEEPDEAALQDAYIRQQLPALYEQFQTMEGADLTGFSELPPSFQNAILAMMTDIDEAGNPVFDVADLNTAIAEARLEASVPQPPEVLRARASEMPSMHDLFDVKSNEWKNMGYADQLNSLARTREWSEFVVDAMSGKVDLDNPVEASAAANRFGFTASPTAWQQITGVWTHPTDPAAPRISVDVLKQAVQDTINAIPKEVLPPPRENPDLVGGAGASVGLSEGATDAAIAQQASGLPPGYPVPATATSSGVSVTTPAGVAPGAPAPSGPPSPIENLSSSPQVLQMVKGEEGFRAEAYQDPGGVWTVGYGQTGPNVGPDTVVTSEQAEQMLAQHIAGVETEIKRNVKVPLTQNQYDALVSLVYNIGGPAFRRSNVLKYINEGNLVAAANAFLEHHRGGGQDNLLLPRRQRERTLFLSSVATGGR